MIVLKIDLKIVLPDYLLGYLPCFTSTSLLELSTVFQVAVAQAESGATVINPFRKPPDLPRHSRLDSCRLRQAVTLHTR